MHTGSGDHALARPIEVGETAETLFWTLAFTVATALAAQVRFPLPFTPVPVTLQTFFVLLAGLMLGSRWGTVSMLGYLAIGAVGLPVFNAGGAGLSHLAGTTAGYLLAYPAAAYLVGWLAGAKPTAGRALGALLAGEALILSAGTVWLALLSDLPLATAAGLGALPFLAGDAVKLAAAAAVGLRAGRRV